MVLVATKHSWIVSVDRNTFAGIIKVQTYDILIYLESKIVVLYVSEEEISQKGVTVRLKVDKCQVVYSENLRQRYNILLIEKLLLQKNWKTY